MLQLLLATTFAVAQTLSSQIKIVPDATWVRIYFESIDKLAGRIGFKPLRLIAIKPGDLEVRIWSGFGISGFGGSIIKRVENRWSAFSLFDPEHTQGVNGRYVEPSLTKGPHATDWAKTWEKLESAGIADIRDDSEIPHCR